MDQLIKQIDAMTDRMTSPEALASAAYHIEAGLGEIERKIEQDTGGTTNATDSAWEHFCNIALEKARQFAVLPFDDEPEKAAAGLYDNYFHVALSLVRAGDAYIDTPALAWAAFNKHSYRGIKDEIACVRLLTWAGFSPNAQDEQGMSPLHYMAFWQHAPGSQPRGVRILLEAGANPNLQNANGDTPLTFMAGISPWQTALSMSAAQLLTSGADLDIQSDDGSTFLSVLKQVEAVSPDPRRLEIIKAVENGMFSAQ